MRPILYATVTEGTVPTNYGLGVLSSCISAKVTEERNGAFEMEMEYPVEGVHASEIEPNKILKVKPNPTDDPQLFRIYKIGKTIDGHFTVYAQHISYDLSGKVITTGTASNCVAACLLLQAQAGNFTIETNKSVSASFKITAPSSVRSWFGGKEGSLLDVFGTGEWKYDNFKAKLWSARGADRSVTIRYGKNLTELSQEIDMSNLASGIVPFYKDSNGNVTTIAEVSTGLVGISKTIAVDFSSSVNPESSTPITTQLSNLAANYISNNNLTTMKNSITLDFVQMQGVTEQIDLCDTVSIYFEALGISAKAKCVSVVYDVLEERYTETTFGDSRTNIADTIAAQQITVEDAASTEDVNKATQLITGNRGGYVVLHDGDGDGVPDEILIMNTPDIDTATKVWRWNQAGLGYASGTHAYAGPYGTAITQDGEIVASFITSGVLNAEVIRAGVLHDENYNTMIDIVMGLATFNTLIAKNSFEVYSDNAGVNLAQIERGPFGGVIKVFDENEVVGVEINTESFGSAVLISNLHGDGVGVFDADSNYSGRMILKDDNGVDNIECLGKYGQITCISLIQTSSRKTKENIKPMEDAAKILELEAVSFDFKNKAQGTNKRGFIAEDVAEILPNLVAPERVDEKRGTTTPAALDYVGMIPYLQTVIKDQERRIKALEERINGTDQR